MIETLEIILMQPFVISCLTLLIILVMILLMLSSAIENEEKRGQ